MDVSIIISLISGIVAVVSSILAYLAVKKLNESKADESDANAAKTVTETALSLLSPLQDTVKGLTEKYDGLETKFNDMSKKNEEERKQTMDLIIDLLYGIAILTKQLDCLGEIPEYIIPEDIPDSILSEYNERYRIE